MWKNIYICALQSSTFRPRKSFLWVTLQSKLLWINMSYIHVIFKGRWWSLRTAGFLRVFLRVWWSISIQWWKASHQTYLLGSWALQPLLEREKGQAGKCVSMSVCSRCKSVKYSSGEGCGINLATLTFFNLDWQVSCQDGNILSSSRFLSIPLWSRVPLHHVCQRGLYWRTLRPDWMLGTLRCVRKGLCMGAGTGGVIILNLQEYKFLCR